MYTSLCVFIMSRTRIIVNPHSTVAWKSRNSLLESSCSHLNVHFTSWKVSVFQVFLVSIFPHSDWIFGPNIREHTNQKNSEYGHFSRSTCVHHQQNPSECPGKSNEPLSPISLNKWHWKKWFKTLTPKKSLFHGKNSNLQTFGNSLKIFLEGGPFTSEQKK